jgi:hypothetical protein
MKYIANIITAILITQLIAYPSHVQAATPKKRVTFSLVKILAHELKTRPAEYFSAEDLARKEVIQENAITSKAIDDLKKKLKDESYSFQAIKQEIQVQLIQEEQMRLLELKSILSQASGDKLDLFFRTAMQDGYYSTEYQFSYQSAYNQREKLEILMQMLSSDLSLIRTQNAKQIGLMSRSDLLKQLEQSGNLFSYKNDKVLTVIIIVLTVAAAGFITWGIISATSARHERKKKELNDDFDQREQDARDQHSQNIQSLEQIFAERERLREEGYVWQICSTTKNTKNATCSYDYKTYIGEEVCVTRCLKQPQTGTEVMHARSCLSSYIPNNCFTKNPTAAGYDDGYDDGYETGYDVGYDRGYDAAYNSAYNNAYSSAYNSGYDDGYSSGFSSGYSDGYSDYSTDDEGRQKLNSERPIKDLFSNDERAMGYKKGFQEGYAYALQLKLGISY